ncbi:MAG: [acyl-carrier-protein] S-malonyltransferase [Puniceicoccaceae bacterium]|nr:MAG: [acyl-carrier-protein] S-malonyltransferase [Puniceicoccaceae bacterium]
MSIALMFSGQGAQTVGMGRSLYENSPLVRGFYQQAGEILGWDLAKASFEGPEEFLTLTKVCQPALYVHGYGMFSLLREDNRLVQVKAMLGLSLGEITALAAAGALDFVNGLRVVAERGRLMQEACDQTRGTMASIIGESRETVSELCREFDIELANLNCPGQIVVSGATEKVNAAVEAAKAKGMRRVIPLKVAGAYHSRLMEPARAAFAEFLESIPFKAPTVPVLTNTTGRTFADPTAIREALVRQVVSPVLWEDCMQTAVRECGVTHFWEIGPGGVLAGLARRINKEWPCRSFAEYGDLDG